MKILKAGTKGEGWWVGAKGECQVCGQSVRLEKGDQVEAIPGAGSITAKCSCCDGAISFDHSQVRLPKPAEVQVTPEPEPPPVIAPHKGAFGKAAPWDYDLEPEPELEPEPKHHAKPKEEHTAAKTKVKSKR